LISEIVVADLLDCYAPFGYSGFSGLSSTVQVLGDLEVTLKRCGVIFPDSEEVYLASDLFAPLAVVVCC